MYAFFQKHLQTPGKPDEEEVEFCSAEELQKTTTGQLSTSLNGETIFSLNRKESEKLVHMKTKDQHRLMASRYCDPGKKSFRVQGTF
jgi:hypothetical protein